MLSLNIINDFIDKIGLDDSSFKVVNADSYGDLIEAFDPDTNYGDVRRAVMDNRTTRNNIIDSGINYYEIADTVYIDGHKTCISILCEAADGVGTTIKVNVKRIEYAVNGEMKSFMSFESLNNYLDQMVK